MQDLQIIELLLIHPDLDGELKVTREEIQVNFLPVNKTDQAYMSHVRELFQEIMQRPVSRIGLTLFVRRKKETPSAIKAAQRAAKILMKK